ncbi:unnamed protein product, partial [Sphagnum jensenii]
QQNSMKSFETGLGFSPNGNEAAVTNMCWEMQQQQMNIVAGMKSFNPGPYVSSAAAVGEEQDVALAGCSRAWFENKSNTAVPVGFDVTHQLGGSTTQQNVAGLQQQSASGSSSRALGPALNTNLKPRARQGSANDPQSIAARVRRERITERLKYLQNLIPNGDKVDMVTMLEKAINYVQCLELQIRMLKDDSLWPKALGALPNTLQELQELAGPEIAGQGQCKSDILESEPKVSTELVEKDRANPSSSHS